MSAKVVPEAYREDIERLLDCFTDASNGDFMRLCSFLRLAVEQGTVVHPVRHLVQLLRTLERHEQERRAVDLSTPEPSGR